MITLRDIYVRHFRGSAFGNAARRFWYFCKAWRAPLKHGRSSIGNTLGWSSGPADSWRDALQQVRLFRYRAFYVIGYHWPRIRTGISWLWVSRESSNFTYDLTLRNEEHLAQFLAFALGRPAEEIAGYIRELRHDQALKDVIIGQVRKLGRQGGYDPTARFGRRVGWYAVVRALKPTVVVETGIEKGLGAAVLCAALLRNFQEGHHCRYYGTDIDRAAGMLLCEPYRSLGTILYGDSIETLSALDVMVDVFINDSDHSPEYEGREYRVIAPKLSEGAVIIADNAHVSDELLKFSRETRRQFLFFREEPANHWYLGAGIGLSFKPAMARA